MYVRKPPRPSETIWICRGGRTYMKYVPTIVSFCRIVVIRNPLFRRPIGADASKRRSNYNAGKRRVGWWGEIGKIIWQNWAKFCRFVTCWLSEGLKSAGFWPQISGRDLEDWEEKSWRFPPEICGQTEDDFETADYQRVTKPQDF